MFFVEVNNFNLQSHILHDGPKGLKTFSYNPREYPKIFLDQTDAYWRQNGSLKIKKKIENFLSKKGAKKAKNGQKTDFLKLATSFYDRWWSEDDQYA